MTGETIEVCRWGGGWTIGGAFLFFEGSLTANLSYRIFCENDWSTRQADVRGWIGSRDWSLRLERGQDDLWTENGHPINLTRGPLDVDFGFTPASNTNAIRRLNLGVGEKTESTAVWLDTSDWSMKPLRQVYERLSSTAFAYAAPLHGYEAELRVNEFGIVSDYPGLWNAERTSSF